MDARKWDEEGYVTMIAIKQAMSSRASSDSCERCLCLRVNRSADAEMGLAEMG